MLPKPTSVEVGQVWRNGSGGKLYTIIDKHWLAFEHDFGLDIQAEHELPMVNQWLEKVTLKERVFISGPGAANMEECF